VPSPPKSQEKGRLTIHGVVVKVSCHACNGKGWVPDKSLPESYGALKPCSLCHQSGQVTSTVSRQTFLDWLEPNSTSDVQEDEWVSNDPDCPDCHGVGVIEKDGTATRCKCTRHD
jgi:DnaJ-class molecular chaperone